MATNPNPKRRPPGTPAGGQFAPGFHPESEVALDGHSSGLEAAMRAEEDGCWPMHSEAPWSWSALSEEVGRESAERLYALSGGRLGKALALTADADSVRRGDPGGPSDPEPGPGPHEGTVAAEALAAERFLRALADEQGYLVGELDAERWAPSPNAEGLRQVSSLPPGLRLPRGCDGCATGDHDACETPDDTYSDEDARGREVWVVSCCCGLSR